MANKKKGGLGRGLDYLFAEGLLSEPTSVIENKKEEKPTAAKDYKEPVPADKKAPVAETVVYIGLNDIRPNSDQPRKDFNQEALEELAASIKEHGVIQPVLLRPASKGYELVAGERRWRAARIAGLKTIPAIVRDLDERQNAFYALIENVQREDLNPIEEADGLLEIIGNYDLTHEQAAKVVGKSRAYVSNALRLAALPEDIRAMVISGELSAGHARAIAGLATESLQREAAQKAVKDHWTVRQVEGYTGTKTRRRRKTTKSKHKSVETRAAEEALTEVLGTKVVINGTEKRGKLEIDYYSRDELDRIIEMLMG